MKNVRKENSKRRLAKPPLSAEQLLKTPIQLRRHKSQQEPICAAKFDVVSDEPPAVATRVIPRLSKGRTRWSIEVRLDSGWSLPSYPPVLEPRIIKRGHLTKVRTREWHPSIPHDRPEFSKKPRLVSPRAEFRLRHGNLEYDPTTIFPPDG